MRRGCLPSFHPPHRRPSRWRLVVFLTAGIPPILVVTLGSGLWLDRRAGWAPWGMLLGMAAGMILATGFIVTTVFLRYRLLAPPDHSADKEMS